MPVSKLTLSVDRNLIDEVKKLAAEEGTSVSALFSRLLRAITHAGASLDVVAPLTLKATGIIHLPGSDSDELVLEDALLPKPGTCNAIIARHADHPRSSSRPSHKRLRSG